MSFSAAELNYLILRYLEESGLTHTAYLLSRESQMDLHEVGNREVPSGALVHVVQKGLSFVELESKAGMEGGAGAENDVPRVGLLDAVTDDYARQRGRERLAMNDMPGTSGQTQRDRDRDARTDRTMGAGSSNGGGGGGAAGHSATPKRDRSVHQSGLSPTNSVSSQSGSGPGRGGGGGAASNQHSVAGGGGGGGSSSTPNGQYNKKQAAMNGMNSRRDSGMSSLVSSAS